MDNDNHYKVLYDQEKEFNKELIEDFEKLKMENAKLRKLLIPNRENYNTDELYQEALINIMTSNNYDKEIVKEALLKFVSSYDDDLLPGVKKLLSYQNDEKLWRINDGIIEFNYTKLKYPQEKWVDIGELYDNEKIELLCLN
jgi:hypothetical protein